MKALSDGFAAVNKDPRTALEPFQSAAALWDSAGDPRMRMWSEQMVGFVQAGAFDRHLEAAATFRRALATALELRDAWAEARLRYNLAVTERTLGQVDEAKADYERAIALHEAAGRAQEAALAGVTGVLIALVFPAFNPFSGTEYTIIAFIVVVLGGLGNPMGALLAGVLYGLAEQMATVFLPQAMAQIVGFVILVATIFFRPSGLLGVRFRR